MATPGQSTNLHKVYSEHGSPMNEYYQAGGEVVAQKMFGNKGRISPAKEATLNTNGGLMYYTYDGLGTVTALHDRHGDKIEDYRYDAFGNLQTGITSPYNVQGYTGHLYDDKSSLVFMNARWYNPSVGRFMSKDTYRGDLAVPQSLNQYAYVMNNPINYVDPTGHIHVYSSGELEGWSRDSLKSLLVEMGVYWNADKEKFEETGVWTQQQEEAHANADLIRELIPYSYQFVRSSSDMSPWQFDGKNEYPDRIESYYSATLTITDIYQNDFGTKTETTTEYYSMTHVESAAEIATNNQSTIEADYGNVNTDFNSTTTVKRVGIETQTNNKEYKIQVKSFTSTTPDSSILNGNTNANVVENETVKSGISNDNDEFETIIDEEVPLASVVIPSFKPIVVIVVTIITGVVTIASQISMPKLDYSNSKVYKAETVDGNTDIDQGTDETNPNLDKVKDKYLEKQGIDAHKLKKDIYGKKSKVAEYDIYVDKNTGELYTQRKPQYNKSNEPPIATGEFIK